MSSVLSRVSHELENLFTTLVLLELISFEMLKTVTQKFAMQCKSPRYKGFVHLLLKLVLDSFFT